MEGELVSLFNGLLNASIGPQGFEAWEILCRHWFFGAQVMFNQDKIDVFLVVAVVSKSLIMTRLLDQIILRRTAGQPDSINEIDELRSVLLY